MPKLELRPGHYPGLHEIEGAPFGISFWTVATDISAEDAARRMEFARELIRRWNEGEP